MEYWPVLQKGKQNKDIPKEEGLLSWTLSSGWTLKQVLSWLFSSYLFRAAISAYFYKAYFLGAESDLLHI